MQHENNKKGVQALGNIMRSDVRQRWDGEMGKKINRGHRNMWCGHKTTSNYVAAS
jgi:hypothetical protein